LVTFGKRVVTFETRLVTFGTRLVTLGTRLVSFRTRWVTLRTRLVTFWTRLVTFRITQRALQHAHHGPSGMRWLSSLVPKQVIDLETKLSSQIPRHLICDTREWIKYIPTVLFYCLAGDANQIPSSSLLYLKFGESLFASDKPVMVQTVAYLFACLHPR